ncbi:hypothetical protein BH11CYA1_BH11CYA1_47870 [soil metagenome]
MNEQKNVVNLDESEAVLALHALRFYMTAKGREISPNSEQLEAKLDQFLDETGIASTPVESVASLLGARGGTIGGASTSEAKAAAAAINGAKGGRPRKPNLFIKFSKGVWHEPDARLLDTLSGLIGNTKWLPEQRGDETEGPYVRVNIEMTKQMSKLLSSSLNVWEWDEKGLYRVCAEHKNSLCVELPASEGVESSCHTCGKPATLIY